MSYEPLDDFMRIGMQDTPDDHPEPEALLAYQAGELAPAEAERLRAHVAACTTCRQCVDDFAALPDLEAEDSPRNETDLATDWADLLDRLRRDEAGAGTPTAPPRVVPMRRPPAVLAWLPLAASLLLATGLGFWGWAEHRRAERMQAAAMVSFAAGATRGDEPTVPAAGAWLDFDLKAGTYRITVVREGANQPSFEATRKGTDTGLRIYVELPPGQYRATVRLIENSDTPPIEPWEYTFNVQGDR